ncbi:MAG: T9SS type A sorting domain-containing protein, partial [Bacteroidia bacterium]
AVAQPIIQSTGLMPFGFTCDVAFTSSVSPGSAGANQTWNFSGLSLTPGGSLNVVSPNSTPCASSFPSANWAENIPTPAVNYYVLSSSQLEVVAENIPSACSGGSSITYSDTKIVLKFPMTYNSSFSDGYVSSAGSGTVTTTYDGYGTLIVPTGTLTNVVRIKIVDGSSTSYEWLTTGNPWYPAVLAQSNATILFSNPAVNVSEIKNDIIFRMYPNPANDKLFIEAPVSERQEVFVYNVNGQMLLSKKISGNEEIDLASVSEGVYSINIKNEKGISSKRLVVVK